MKVKSIIDVRRDNSWDYIDKLDDGSYIVTREIRYFSERYNKLVVCEVGDPSDGATYARDIKSFSWIVHDDLKKYKKFEKGDVCSNFKASKILYDILKAEGHGFRARSWFTMTLLWGSVVR